MHGRAPVPVEGVAHTSVIALTIHSVMHATAEMRVLMQPPIAEKSMPYKPPRELCHPGKVTSNSEK